MALFFNLKKLKPFPSIRQPNIMDCGPTCLRIISKHYGRDYSLRYLREISYTSREGSSLSQLASAAEIIGFRTLGAKISYSQLVDEAPMPCIVLWDNNHFIVVYRVTKDKVYVSDPGMGLITYTKTEFLEHWIGYKSGAEEKDGIVLLFETTPEFYGKEPDEVHETVGFEMLKPYIRPHKRYMWQIFMGLLAGSVMSLIMPFLTQSVVDIGIRNRDIHFVYLLLFAQLFLFFGSSAIGLIRGWLMMHMSSRINISMIADFFTKLMKLPISYFDTKMTGDILQRISDHVRVQQLLTGSAMSILFSLMNIIIFGLIIFFYDPKIFLIFFAGSVLYIGWVVIFLKRRAILDYKRFALESQNQDKILELINGMQETKMHNAERPMRWSWEGIQARLFKHELSRLRLAQIQSFGANVINEVKNILISFVTASLVISGEITLGAMLSISYIIGQLNGPISDIVSFMHSLQDARLSLERIGEIQNRADEEPVDKNVIREVPESSDLELNKVSFQYSGPESGWVLKNLNLKIPARKITAIVGGSGSGKTTILKLLMKFYEPTRGVINYGAYDLSKLAFRTWREKCGVVMQEGFIFDDSIAKNIAVGHDEIDQDRLVEAAEIANIREFIESLPLAYNTKIGQNGVGVSGGQKQRILIARAVYKDPEIIMFDEATSALDSKNERIIMENFEKWFNNRTVIIIAHRLSTVKNADQIAVVDAGRVIEVGNHEELLALKGSYYSLVKNQLELDKLDA
ncbi:MAG: ATP-binding cassette subfamily B protein [Bacteroidia bacterium]